MKVGDKLPSAKSGHSFIAILVIIANRLDMRVKQQIQK